MRQFVYPAVLEPDTEVGGFVVTFPDVPEAITQGNDLTDALRQAVDCLDEAIVGRLRRNQSIPEASPVRSAQRAIALPAQTAAKAALHLAIRQANLTPTEVAERLGCDEERTRRLLDPRRTSRLDQLESALAALGQQLVVSVRAAS